MRGQSLRILALLVVLAASAAACDRRDDRADDVAGTAGATTTSARGASTTSVPPSPANASPSPACDTSPTPPVERGRSERKMLSSGVERSYLLYVPDAPPEPLPLVLNLHGFGSNAAQQVAYSGVEPVAERENFVTVAPDGVGTPPRFELIGTSDVTFIGEVIEEIGRLVCIDEARVYSMGMSNGGAMSAVLACRIGDRIAAIAPVTVLLYTSLCDSAPPMPIVGFAGTADPVVPFNGGRVNCCGNPSIGSAPDAMTGWAEHNGCAREPTITSVASDVERRTWGKCTDDAEAVFYVIEDGGHTWPGAIPIAQLGNTTASIEATEVIWEFFAAHQRAGAGSN